MPGDDKEASQGADERVVWFESRIRDAFKHVKVSRSSACGLVVGKCR
jgi:hypothetical protein